MEHTLIVLMLVSVVMFLAGLAQDNALYGARLGIGAVIIALVVLIASQWGRV